MSQIKREKCVCEELSLEEVVFSLSISVCVSVCQSVHLSLCLL